MIKEKSFNLGLCGIVDDLGRTIEFFEDGTYRTNVNFKGVKDGEKAKTIDNIILRSVIGKNRCIEDVGITEINEEK